MIISNNFQWVYPTAKELLRSRQDRNNRSLAKKVEARRLLRQWRKEDAAKEAAVKE